MRQLLIIAVICALSCHHSAQENTASQDRMEQSEKIDLNSGNDNFDIVKIDSILDIQKGTKETSQTFIKKRLEALVGNFLKEKCAKNGLNYPPKFVLFRFFKYEKEFELWAGNSNKDSLRRILLLPVCAVDAVPGTKLQVGDGKTPEGFYDSPLYYGSTADFMWIKLNNKEIDTYGSVGYGSSFKMCLDYPNSLDKQRTKTILKDKSPGSAICIHGNCVSIGCISFINRNYLPVFLAALGHNTKAFGEIKIHIFPFRFNQTTDGERAKFAENVNDMPKAQVLETWKNLEVGYNLFNKNCRALNIKIRNYTNYTYSNY